jgi:glyoxylase-like metal-dependent hydrolase (beta-lactamase superfamily II)
MNDRSSLIAGTAVEIAAGLRRVVAPNAGLMTGPGTNTYLLGVRELAVIDPGPDEPAHLEAILDAAAGVPISWILVTHTHRDHSPLAAALSKRTGAVQIGLPPPHDGRQDEHFSPDQRPVDGGCIRLGDVELVAIHTPGHASNCVCYFLPRARCLLTGDHVLEGVSPVILPPDGDMSAYLSSLDKLLRYDFDWIAPGHGAVMPHGHRAVAALRAHRLAREEKVLARLAVLGEASLERLTPAVYDDVPADRHAWARLTLEAHLIKLARERRVACERDGWRIVGA